MRVGIKVKFIRNCVVELPAAPVTYDNTAQGGTATDSFIIYGYGGLKKFPLSAPLQLVTKFSPGDKDCDI